METNQPIIPQENEPVVHTKPEISLEDFLKADVRLCEIVSAIKVEKADKLLKLTIKTGFDERVVMSAIAEKITPDELVGKKLPFVLNLPVKKIRGIESRGMIIMAEDSTRNYYPLTSDFAPGGSVVI